MKESIFTTDHTEIIHSVWDSMPTEQKRAMIQAVINVSKELHPGEKAPRLGEVVRASWSMGFHYAMLAVEQGALIKAGPVKPENN
jgi:hypothetical protein